MQAKAYGGAVFQVWLILQLYVAHNYFHLFLEDSLRFLEISALITKLKKLFPS